MSSNKSNNADNGTPQATEQEARFFFSVLKHNKNKLEVNWDAVANECGYNNAGTAKVRFGQMKRRLGLHINQPGTSPAKTPTKTPTKRGAQDSAMGSARKRTKTHDDDMNDVSDDDDVIFAGKNKVKTEDEEKKMKSEDEV